MLPPPTDSLPPRRLSLVESTCQRLAEHVAAELAEPDGSESWLPSERSLASRLGVSRPVIREATQRLELRGLVEIQHGRGIKVVRNLQRPLSEALRFEVPDDLERLRQLNEVRRSLEPELTRLAATRASEDQLAALTACHEELAVSSRIADAARIDARFHELIARSAGNSVAALLLASFGDLAEHCRLRTLATTGLDKAVEHHAAILDSLRSRDPESASRLMAYHLDEASHDLEASERNAPDEHLP